mmetsp:Transcript_28774/g.81169  ORF Transcript_28774/g.81169 Transcript_28774/m.81169 type:complete len:356 (+) Transcript_28774:152-1219(+)|eukprot:CAMPEP_0119558200 /NCGR_PEP_ID=MMETSP1352-20130426/10317_1 /TAXON_ID=265584 /ORGANISM="Stauroneis constricta, Strain CCMP1120" /LENGTH=355 /DNA_ID=CAMNT_0007605481 /DNA_START=151 /DNA_END=1218 /DNA_ORIENTATION=-
MKISQVILSSVVAMSCSGGGDKAFAFVEAKPQRGALQPPPPSQRVPQQSINAGSTAAARATPRAPIQQQQLNFSPNGNNHVENPFDARNTQHFEYRHEETAWQQPTNSLSTRPSSRRRKRRSTRLSFGMGNVMALAETVAPKLGIITSLALFLSPAKAVYDAINTSSLNDLNPLPIALMAMSGASWLSYGIVTQNPYVVASNSPGCILSIAYLAGILPLLSKSPALMRSTQKILVAGAAACFSLWTCLSISKTSIAAAAKIIGLFSSGLTLVLFASPLAKIKEVIASQDASSILAPLTVAQVVNTALWAAYGQAVNDSMVFGPNAIGLALGLVQLALKIVFAGGKSPTFSKPMFG